ncbi:NRDE family protein, partial [Curtobacterium sp. CT11-133]|uniref:NRDE family protein n=1 Tax=Curtobacterium sp. CT11-133 TaxID=3243014 RepID=UPI0039B072E8
TVVVRVDPGSEWPVTMLAMRDESPERPWDPPAAWWPERDPSIRGVRDRSAGGAWLAASDGAGLAVVLNRGEPVPSDDGTWTTRGVVPLDAVTGALPGHDGTLPTTRAFNLVRATADGAEVTTWDGTEVRTTALGPGVHMVTHGEPDDPAAPRIGRWLDAFRAVDAPVGPPVLGPFDELRAADRRGHDRQRREVPVRLVRVPEDRVRVVRRQRRRPGEQSEPAAPPLAGVSTRVGG